MQFLVAPYLARISFLECYRICKSPVSESESVFCVYAAGIKSWFHKRLARGSGRKPVYVTSLIQGCRVHVRCLWTDHIGIAASLWVFILEVPASNLSR
jgi:hypothetical protein